MIMAKAPPAKGAKPGPGIITSTRFTPAVRAALDKAAEADTRTTSSLIQKIVTEWLKEKGFLK
jgi:hypothetical protein